MAADIVPFFHNATGSFSYLVVDAATRAAAIVDPVLDFDVRSGRVETLAADAILAHVHDRGLAVQYVLETHAHADRLSAGAYLRDALGATLAIGAGIVAVQAHFRAALDLGDELVADGSQFDRLLKDGDVLPLGESTIAVLATPGHTADGVAYVVSDASGATAGDETRRRAATLDVIVGDTLFAPDVGTARCDFPGGDAAALHRSIARLLALPDATTLWLCHDYPPRGREPAAATTVAAQRAGNAHVANRSAEDYVALRTARDATLPVPQLLWPAIQVNIRGGRLPAPAPNGVAYLRLPVGPAP